MDEISSRTIAYLANFAQVVEKGSISAAARSLGLTQPSLSRQVFLLEEELGIQLFRRQGKGVVLTESGRTLHSQVSEKIFQVQNALESVRSATSRISGILHFGTYTEIGQTALFKLALKFQLMYPTVQLQVGYMKENEMIDSLLDRRLDCAVFSNAKPHPDIQTDYLLTERVVLVTRRSNSKNIVTSEDFKEARFVSYRAGDPLLTSYVGQFESTGKKRIHFRDIHILMTVNSHRSIIDALNVMPLYAVMPWQSVQEHVQMGVLRLASDVELVNKLYIASLNTKRRRVTTEFCKHMLIQGKEL